MVEGVKVRHPPASGESTRLPTQNRPSSPTATLRHPATATEEDRAAVEGRAGAAAAAAADAAAAAAGVAAAAGAGNHKRTAALYLHAKKEILCLSRKFTLSKYC